MTEQEAITVASQLMQEKNLQHAGVSKAVFVSRDHPLHVAPQSSDAWLIFFDFPDCLINPRMDTNSFTVEVDCNAKTAILVDDL